MANRLARTLMRRVSAVGDAQVRVALVRSLVGQFAAEELAGIVRALVEEAGMRNTAAQLTLLALTEATAGDPSGLDRVSVETSGGEDGLAPPADWGIGRPLTLGERKSLARRPDRKLLERAMGDAHPDVISELLQNPRLTELDVTRMCSSRRALPETLARVFASPRWASRPRVRASIASNPRAPVAVALALVPLLARGELRELAGDERVDSRVRSRALEVLRRLPPTPEGPKDLH